MKKILIVLGILIVLAAVIAISYANYLGAFTKIKVSEKEMGPFYFVYTMHKGDYSKVGPVMLNVCNKLTSQFNIKPERMMGIYYSDPKTVKTADLKSDVGCLLEKADSHRADEIMSRMKVRIMFPKQYCTAEFPMKNQMSIVLGIMKVYPEITKYMKSNGYRMTPAMEIYEKGRIVYAFEIKK